MQGLREDLRGAPHRVLLSAKCKQTYYRLGNQISTARAGPVVLEQKKATIDTNEVVHQSTTCEPLYRNRPELLRFSNFEHRCLTSREWRFIQ